MYQFSAVYIFFTHFHPSSRSNLFCLFYWCTQNINYLRFAAFHFFCYRVYDLAVGVYLCTQFISVTWKYVYFGKISLRQNARLVNRSYMFSKGSKAKKKTKNETNFNCNHNKCGTFVLKNPLQQTAKTHTNTHTNDRPSPCFLYEVLLINYARAGVRRSSKSHFQQERKKHWAQKHENQVQNHD